MKMIRFVKITYILLMFDVTLNSIIREMPSGDFIRIFELFFVPCVLLLFWNRSQTVDKDEGKLSRQMVLFNVVVGLVVMFNAYTASKRWLNPIITHIIPVKIVFVAIAFSWMVMVFWIMSNLFWLYKRNKGLYFFI